MNDRSTIAMLLAVLGLSSMLFISNAPRPSSVPAANTPAQTGAEHGAGNRISAADADPILRVRYLLA